MIKNNPNLEDKRPIVALIATPIGNLKDITYRAIEYLKDADIIACEDTRTTSLLLNQYDIKNKKLVPLYAQTELKGAKELVEKAKKDKLKVAYCSDAGMPGISDPGALLVQACYQLDVPVTVLPGASAAISGLVLSGIDSADFTFFGFLPTKKGAIEDLLDKVSDRKETLIFYESPKRVMSTLQIMKKVFGGDREVSLIRELTKIHEEVIHGTLDELCQNIIGEVKGECMIVVKGNQQAILFSDEEIKKLIKQGLKEGKSLSTLSKELSLSTGVKKNQIYKIGLSITK